MPERDAFGGFHFFVEIDGITQAFFREAGGLTSESTVMEHKFVQKDGTTVVQKVPGYPKFGDITLKRGITDVMELWNWRKMVEDGKVNQARKEGSIVMYNQENKEVARWNFTQAWPSKISGPQLNAQNSDIGIEEITIAHEGMKRVK
jgi:phage tail-like protein